MAILVVFFAGGVKDFISGYHFILSWGTNVKIYELENPHQTLSHINCKKIKRKKVSVGILLGYKSIF